MFKQKTLKKRGGQFRITSTAVLISTISLCLTIFSFTPLDNIVGKYEILCHKDAFYSIDVNPDSTFKQRNRGQLDYVTDGTWTVKSDTLCLNIKTVYEVSSKRKTTPVSNPSSYTYQYAMKHSNYKIKQDKLLMLYKISDTTTISTCWLSKIKRK